MRTVSVGPQDVGTAGLTKPLDTGCLYAYIGVMKARKLIKALREAVQEHGDLEVCVEYDSYALHDVDAPIILASSRGNQYDDHGADCLVLGATE